MKSNRILIAKVVAVHEISRMTILGDDKGDEDEQEN